MEQDISEDHRLPDAAQLNDLLDLLAIPAASGLPSFGDRQRSANLSHVLKRTRRIAAATGNREQIALTDFHLGLYLFLWNEWSGAIQHFERAREEAVRENNKQLSCLSLFAIGCMKQRNFEFEDALAAFTQVEKAIRDLRGLLGVRGFDARQNQSHVFLDELTVALQQSQRELNADLEEDMTMRLEEPSSRRVPTTIQATDSPPAQDPSQRTAPIPDVGPPIVAPHVEPPRVTFSASGAPRGASKSTSGLPASVPINAQSSQQPTLAMQPKPDPFCFGLRSDYELFCVLETSAAHGSLIGLSQHDWLIVKKQERNYNTGDYVVVGATSEVAQLSGSTRVNEECTRQSGRPPRYVGRVEESSARTIFVNTGADRPLKIEPAQPFRVGRIIGLFRYLSSRSRAEVLMPWVNEQMQVANCEDSPHPRYFWLADGILIYCVAGRTGRFILQDVLPGDWLLANAEPQEPMDHDPIIVGGSGLQGEISVRPNPMTTQMPRFAGEYLQSQEADEIECLLGEGQRYQLLPDMQVETVIGFFRYLARQR